MVICCDVQNENIQIGHSREGAAATGIAICPMKESPYDVAGDAAEGLLILSAIVVRPVVPRLLSARATQTAIDGNWVGICLSASLNCIKEPAMSIGGNE